MSWFSGLLLQQQSRHQLAHLPGITLQLAAALLHRHVNVLWLLAETVCESSASLHRFDVRGS